MKVKLYTFMDNNGDGSASVYYFNTQKDAEEYAAKMDELCGCGERFCDDLSFDTFEFDDTGYLLNAAKLSDLEDW